MRNFGFAVLFLSLAGCSEPNSESTSAHADHDTAQHHDADHDDIGHAAVEKSSNKTDHEMKTMVMIRVSLVAMSMEGRASPWFLKAAS